MFLLFLDLSSLFLSQVIGILFCAIALHQLKTKKEKGHGLAMAGLIISIIVLAVIVIGAILAVIFWGILRPHGIS